jgi:hypothetical protein
MLLKSVKGFALVFMNDTLTTITSMDGLWNSTCTCGERERQLLWDCV